MYLRSILGLAVYLAVVEIDGSPLSQSVRKSPAKVEAVKLPDASAVSEWNDNTELNTRNPLVIKGGIDTRPRNQVTDNFRRRNYLRNVRRGFDSTSREQESLDHSINIDNSKIEDGTEITDSEGIVHGRYTFNDNGEPSTIEYKAGPDIGFLVTSSSSKKIKRLYDSAVDNNGNSEDKKYVVNIEATMKEESPDSKGVAEVDKTGFVRGSFSFRDPNENLYVVEYETGSDTFSIINITKQEVQREFKGDQKPVIISTYSSLEKLLNDSPDVVLSKNPEVEGKNEKSDISLTLPSKNTINSSYKFGFSTDDQSRQEEADTDGNVHGSYSYMDNSGLLTRVEYEAGAKKGFVIKNIVRQEMNKISENNNQTISNSEHLKISNGQKNYKAMEKHDFSVSTPLALFTETSQNPSNDYETSKDEEEGLSSSEVILDLSKIRRAVAVSDKVDHSNDQTIKKKNVVIKRPINKPSAESFTRIMPDGSYAFSYVTDDHSRQQSVDSNGNVYSNYVYNSNDDGQRVVVFQTNSLNIQKSLIEKAQAI